MFNQKISKINEISQYINKLLFGKQNRRLEYVVEKFYELNLERRALIKTFVVILFCLLFSIIIFIYIKNMNLLEKNLSQAYQALYEIKRLNPIYSSIEENFLKLQDQIKSTNTNLNLIELLKEKSSEMDIEISDFSNAPSFTNLENSNPFSEQFEIVSINFQVKNISLKKMINYINFLEESKNKLKITELKILSEDEEKLYFNIFLTLEALIPKEEKNKKF
jgi:hypothetical protein